MYQPADFYPRSPCGERRVHYDNYNLHCVISIHALLAESDFHLFASSGVDFAISIHALLAESDNLIVIIRQHSTPFLSTLSLRRATNKYLKQFLELLHFYPRSPCGERLTRNGTFRNAHNFYPRSPCGERHSKDAHSGL